MFMNIKMAYVLHRQLNSQQFKMINILIQNNLQITPYTVNRVYMYFIKTFVQLSFKLQ